MPRAPSVLLVVYAACTACAPPREPAITAVDADDVDRGVQLGEPVAVTLGIAVERRDIGPIEERGFASLDVFACLTGSAAAAAAGAGVRIATPQGSATLALAIDLDEDTHRRCSMMHVRVLEQCRNDACAERVPFTLSRTDGSDVDAVTAHLHAALAIAPGYGDASEEDDKVHVDWQEAP